jgi:hypothetical protein
MFRVWLKDNWKEIFASKTVIIEIADGEIADFEIPEHMDLIVINHDNLYDDLPIALENLGYEDSVTMAQEIHDLVADVMRETQNENLEAAIKAVLAEHYIEIDDEDEEVLITIVED